MIRRMVLAVCAALSLGQCSTPSDTPTPAPSEPIVVTDPHGDVVDMPAGVRWDVTYGQLADDQVPAFVAECQHQGGEPVRLTDGTHMCENVDY